MLKPGVVEEAHPEVIARGMNTSRNERIRDVACIQEAPGVLGVGASLPQGGSEAMNYIPMHVFKNRELEGVNTTENPEAQYLRDA